MKRSSIKTPTFLVGRPCSLGPGSPVRILIEHLGAGELLAVREHEPGKWLVVVYRELNGDGFIITAFETSRIARLRRRRQIWP